MRNMRWTSACLAGGLLLSAYACGGNSDSGGTDEDDSSGGAGGTDGGSGGDGGGGSSGGGTSSGGDGGTSSGGTTSTTTTNSTTDSGGSSVGGNGGSAGEGGSGGNGGVPPIDCAEDADCENAGMVCDPLTELCVPCLFDDDCGAGERCDGTTCVDAVDCVTSGDCEGVSGTEACDTAAGHCVECVSASDCPGTADCIDQHCRAYRACDNSLDCPTPRVCDSSAGRCVQCVYSADCEDGLTCVSNTCRRTCSSDNDCTALGLLCDLNYGACSRCSSDSDCPGVYHCATGRCELDSCEAGSGYCEGNTLYSCNAAGSGYQATTCYSGTTCVEGAQAICQEQICTPGATECNGANTALITCAEDGLSIESSTECGADEICYQEECKVLACPPLEYFCEGNERRYCYSDGMSSYLAQTCSAGTFCDPETAQCADLLCEPDAPACNSGIATTCNEAGDGYVDGGTDCSDTEEFCVNGECQECNGTVLFLGDDDTTGNAAIQTALENAGLVVTLMNSGVRDYTGTPAAAGFGAVLHHVGSLYSNSMAQAGQDSIVAAQAAGTGFVSNEWASYQQMSGYSTSLGPLTLLSYGTSTTSTATITLTSASHPIWDGVPTSFTPTIAVGVTYGLIVNSGVAIATCAGCDSSGTYSGAAVVVREGTGGRLVHFANSGNSSDAYLDANLLKLYVNAAQWATGCK